MGLLDQAAYIADTPGALLRGALSAKFGQRKTGREMLEAWGMSENKPGLDTGDVAGFLADVVLDPINLLGGAGIVKGAKYLGKSMAGRKAAAGVAATRKGYLAEALARPAAEAAPIATRTAAPLKPGLQEAVQGTKATAPAARPAAASLPPATVKPKPVLTPKPWHDDVVQQANNTTLSTPLTIPDLFADMAKKHPGLTEAEFKSGMLALQDSGKLRMMEYTRAPAEIAGKMAIETNWGDPLYYVFKPRTPR